MNEVIEKFQQQTKLKSYKVSPRYSVMKQNLKNND